MRFYLFAARRSFSRKSQTAKNRSRTREARDGIIVLHSGSQTFLFPKDAKLQKTTNAGFKPQLIKNGPSMIFCIMRVPYG